jgi:hypothetical protein
MDGSQGESLGTVTIDASSNPALPSPSSLSWSDDGQVVVVTRQELNVIVSDKVPNLILSVPALATEV